MSKAQFVDPVILVDGSSYLFRAYHALPPLNNSKGQPTGAVKGVIAMTRRLQQEYPNSKIIMIFDAKGKNFRHDLYVEYKANRPPMPDDLRSQIEPIHQIIKAMGLPLLIVPEVEADDVIGTLAKEASEKGIDTIISTGDKDMAQLVTDHVVLMNTMTDTYMDRTGVIDKFGIPPERIIDFLALTGDSVDNIPGIPKCGPKTAVKWLTAYDSMQGVIESASQIKGKIGETLREHMHQLPLSYQLATIKTDVSLAQSLDEITPAPSDSEALLALYQELEFKGWIKELDQDSSEDSTVAKPAASAAPETHYETLFEQDALDRWIKTLEQADIFAFDTETTSLNYMEAEIVGVSFAVEPGKAAYVPLAHSYMGAPEQLDRDQVLQQLKPLLEDDSLAKVGQNLKYDLHVLANHGIQLRGIKEDTMLQSYVLDSNERHDMDSLAENHLGLETVHFEDIAGKGAKQLRFDEIEIERAAPYAAEDADITLRLYHEFHQKLADRAGQKRVYEEIEVPLLPALARTEAYGVLVDAQLLGTQSQELQNRMVALEKEAFDIAGEEFNLGSPKQLQRIFYEKLELPVIKKTPKGQPSTAEPVLQELAHDYPLPKVLLEYRSLSKLKSTYTDKLPLQINPRTGRVHTSYQQAVAATGRLSSTDPNLQNIPVRNAEGRRIRQAFIAPEGYKLMAADYSQIELRIMAHLSGDKGLLDAFAQGEDVHKATAAEVFGVTPLEVSDDQRRSAKAINFGLIYGMSAFGLTRQLGVDRATAQGYIDRYFEKYPGVKAYMDRIRQQAHDQEYVETLFGRRLNLPEINARNKMRQQAAERTAINAPMQGTAADIIKLAMINVDRWLLEEQVDARIVMQVHDELVLEVAESQRTRVEQKLRELMSGAAKLDVPLVVDVGIGDNWEQAH